MSVKRSRAALFYRRSCVRALMCCLTVGLCSWKSWLPKQSRGSAAFGLSGNQTQPQVYLSYKPTGFVKLRKKLFVCCVLFYFLLCITAQQLGRYTMYMYQSPKEDCVGLVGRSSCACCCLVATQRCKWKLHGVSEVTSLASHCII